MNTVRHIFIVTIFAFGFQLCNNNGAQAQVTTATGGSAITADNFATTTYTTLTNPKYTEAANGAVGTGTIILNAPSGFIFDVGGTAPTVLITRVSGNGANSRNINSVASGTSAAITSRTTTLITFTVSNSSNSGVTCSLTWQNVRVKPTAGSPLATGNITKTGTSTITGVTNGTTNFGTLTEIAGALDQLILSQTITAQTAGTAFNMGSITAEDQFNNVLSATNGNAFNSAVTLSTDAPFGSVSPTTTTTLTNGVLASQNITVTQATSQIITATSGAVTGTTNSFSVTAGAFSKMQVVLPGETAAPGSATGKTASPNNATAGTAYTSITVNAVDANWNKVSSAPANTIAITSSDVNAVLPSNNTLSSGTQTFSVTFKTAGTQTVTATNASDGTKTANTSSNITVGAGAFAKLQLLLSGEIAAPGTVTGKTGAPGAQTAGTAFNITVNAVDANWNVVNTVTDNIGITSTDVNAGLPANSNLASGTKIFSFTFKTVGTWTITATDVTDGSKTANTSPNVTVSVGAFAKLQVILPGETAAPGTVTGKTGSPNAAAVTVAYTGVIVNAVDANWNKVSAAPANTIAITSSDANAVLPSNNTLSSGTQTFSITFKTAGNQTVTATNASDGTKTANTSSSIAVSAGAFAKLQILLPGEIASPGSALGKTSSPTAENAGTNFLVTVNAVDANWNIVSSAPADNIHLTSTDVSATMPANAPLSSGTETFTLALVTAGSKTITAADATDGTKTANTSAAVTINAYATAASDFFRSNTASGNWVTAASWQSSHNNADWFTASAAPTSSAQGINIQATHTIFVLATPSSNNLTVNGTFEHRFNGGTIPTATWNSGATLLITGATGATVPGGLGQSFYNLNWNWTTQNAAVNLAGALTTVNGTLTISSTNTGSLSISNTTGAVISVGNFLQTAGTFFLNNGGGSNTTTMNVSGDFTKNAGAFTTDATHQSTVNFNGSGSQNIAGTGAVTFYNLTLNQGSSANTVTNSSKAFTVGSDLTVTQGNLVLQATDNNYTVTGNLTVSPNGTLTHSVDWNAVTKMLGVGGNVDITGIFNPTIRSHLQMNGTGAHTIRTAAAGNTTSTSTLSILTFLNGTFSANGIVKTNQEVWAMFGSTGSFSTAGNDVTVPTIINNNGSINVNGGSLTVNGGAEIGNSGTAGSLNVSSTGILTVAGDLTIDATGSMVCTNSPAINLRGNFINNGVYTKATETVTFNGGGAQAISGSTATSFANLTVSNSVADLTLSTSASVSGILNFINGNIVTGSNTLSLGSAASVTGAAQVTGWVNGKLLRTIPTGAQTKTFDVGDATNYTPVTVAIGTVNTSGNLTVSTTAGDHLNIGTSIIDPTKSVNRYWTLTNAGMVFTTASVTFNFVAGDKDGGVNTSTFAISGWNGSTWNLPAVGTLGLLSSQATGVTSFGDFIIGNVLPVIANNTISAPQGICSGATPLALTGSLPTGGNGTTYTYLWESSITSATTGFGTATGTSNGQNYTPGALTQTTWYRRTVTSAGRVDVTTAIQITVNPLPGDNAGADRAYCTPGSTTIGATTTGGHTYSWSPSTNLTSSTISNPGASPAVNTTYTLTETITATGCSSVNSVVVNANPLPGDNAGADQVLCTGDNIGLGAANTSGHTYSWSPAGTLSSSTISNPTANPTVATTYTLTEVITATGCSAVNTVAVGVNPLPADKSVTVVTNVLCSGTGTNLQVAASVVGVNYQLRNNSGNTSIGSPVGGNGGTINLPTGTLTTTTTFNVDAIIAATGCDFQLSATPIVYVNPAPAVSVTPSPASICNLATSTLTATNSAGTVDQVFSNASGTISVAIADGSKAAYIYPTLNLVGGGTTTLGPTDVVNVTLSITHNNDQDLDIFLVDPSGTKAMLLTSDNGSSGNNYTNTVLTTNAGTSITSGTAPFSGTFTIEGGISTVPDLTGAVTGTYSAVVPASALLGATIDGLWSLRAFDDNNNGSAGILTSWALSITHNTSYTTVITGNPTIGAISYSGTNNTTATASVTPPVGSNIYTATTTDGAGCTVSNTATVTVNPLPTDNSGTDQTICNGGNAGIGAANNAADTYHWSPATALTSSTVSNPTANPTTTTTYTLTETIAATGCTTANSVIVNVNPVPVNNTGGNKAICINGSVVLGAANTSGHTYTWSPATSLTSSTVSNPTANPTATITYTLTEVITATGCSAVNSIIVTVNPLPGDNAGSDKTYCNGNNVALGTTTTAGHTYSWTPTTNLTSSTVSNPTASPTTTTTYTLTETITATGCTIANSVIVNVNAVPANNTGGNKPICNGGTVAIGAGNIVGDTYSWSPATGLSSSTISNPNANPASTTTYTLTETITSTGCFTNSAAIVIVNSLPAFTVGATGATTFCQGSAVTLNTATAADALSFNGTNTFVATPNLTSFFPTSAMTVEIWFKANAAGVIVDERGQANGVGGWQDSHIEITGTGGTGTVKVNVWNATGTATALTIGTAAYGTWNHAVVRYDGTKLDGFLNGVKSASSVTVVRQSPQMNALNQYWTLGQSDVTNLGSGAFFNGQMDEMRIWNIARTDLQITGAWNTPVSTSSANLVAYYKMDDGSGTTLADASGNGNTATLFNSPTWVIPSTAPINYYSGYSWSPGGGTTSTISANTTATYSLTVTDVNGCTGTGSKSVTVNPIPVDNAGADQAVCNGSGTTIGAANTVGHTYSWTPATTLTSSTISNPTATPTLTTTYTLTETITATGCTAANSAVITVNPLPANNTGGNKVICFGGSTALGASSVAGHTYSWSPAGTLTSSTISNPTASPTVTTTYTLTETITATGCTIANSAVVTVNPLPVVSITPNYCFGGGHVQLAASPATGSSYLWSNGSTINPTLVDEAGIYVVTVTTSATGCTSSNSVTIAIELTTNGNFSTGTSAGFTTGYTNNQTDLTVEGRYAITQNAHTQHTLFFGTDHTNPPTGYFMAVNGSPLSVQPTVWQETVNINPNTTYYFSAWATSLNQVGNYAILQFNVNGAQIGSPANLTQGANSTAGPFVWTRFYGTWTSGPTDVTAVISIVDLQTATGGNDFGIDDISCSTLSPVTFAIAPTGNGGVPVCVGSNFSLNANLTGGTSPFTFSWTGPLSYTSNVQNPSILNATTSMAGNYNLTVTDGYGCSVTGIASLAVSNYPLDRTVSVVASNICTGSSTNAQVLLSQTGVTYQLRNDANDANIGTGVAGTGGTISLPTGTLTSNTTFNVLATTTGSSCSTQMSVTPTVTINTKSGNPTSATASSGTICNTQSTTLTLNNGGGGTGEVIKWYTGSCGGTLVGTGNNLTVSPSTTTTYFGRYEDPAPCSVNTTCSSVTITVNALPTDKTPTAQASAVCNGTSTNIQITTSQSGVKYQLRNNTDNSNVGTSVNGTGFTISLPTGNLSATTTFNVLATNNTTTCSVQMVNTVTVIVNALTVIGTQPTSTTVCSPTAINLSVGATGTNLTYQWKFNAGNISGATTNSFSIASTSAANTGSYTVVVTGTCGTTTSNAAAVTINVAPAITTNPVGSSVCLGSAINMSVVATGTPLNYQWQKNSSNISGATNSSFSIASSVSTDAADYDVVITNTCGTTTSTIATVTVSAVQNVPYLEDFESISGANQLPNCVTTTNLGSKTFTIINAATSHSGTKHGYFGSSTNDWFFTPGINLTAGTPYEFSFWYRTDNTAAALSFKGAVGTAPFNSSMSTNVGTQISGAGVGTTNVYHQYTGVYTPATTGVYYFGVNATTNPGQSSDKVDVDDIAVNLACVGTPTAGTASVSNTFVCAGTNVDLSLTGYTTGFSGITFQWQSTPTGQNTWSDISGATTSDYTTQVTASSDYRCKVTCIYSGLSANSNALTVNANIPSANPVSATATLTTICSGQSVTLTLNGGGGGTGEVIKWYTSSCGGTLAGTGNNLVVSPIITTTYFGRYEDAAPCNPSTTCASVKITVNTTPIATATNQGPYCSYQNIALLSGPNGMATYSWVGPNSYTSASQNPILAASGNGGTYNVTVTTSNGCTSSASTDVTVNVPAVVSVTPNNSTICSTDTITLTASGSVNYTWSPSIQLSATAGAVINVYPSVSTTYTVTGTDANSCTTSATSAFTVKPVPVVTVTPPVTICTGATVVVLTASGAPNGYTWQPATFLNATTGSVVTAQISRLTFYTVTGTGANGCTASVVVPVATIPSGGLVTPLTNVICKGGTRNLVVSGAAGNFYQWQMSKNDTLWTDIAGATKTTYTTNSADGFSKKYYRLLAKSNACYNISSTTAVVDTSATPTVTVTNVTSTSATVTWRPYASGQYTLSWTGAAGSGSAPGVTTNSFLITPLLPNSNLLVTITPVTPSCSGVSPSTASTRTLCAKPVITNLSATPFRGFKVNWTSVPGANSYRVYYRDLGTSGSWSFVDTTGTTKTISVFYGGHKFAVYVAAKDCPGPGNLGDGSALSYVSTNPGSSCGPVPTVSASSSCPNQIHVDISGSTPPFNLILRRVTPSLTSGASYPINSSSVDITVGTQYAGATFEIFATKNCGANTPTSIVSNVFDVTVKPGCPIINNLVVSHVTCGGFTASWNTDDCAGLGISGYQLLIKKNGTPNFNGYPTGVTDHAVVGWLNPGLTYDVVIMSTSCNGAASGYSVADTVFVPGCGRVGDAPADAVVESSVQNDKETVSVYPNPSNGQFYISLGRTDVSEAMVKIELVNQLGQVVQTNLAEVTGGHLNQVINSPEGIVSGIYFVRTTVGGNVYVSRIMISKE